MIRAAHLGGRAGGHHGTAPACDVDLSFCLAPQSLRHRAGVKRCRGRLVEARKGASLALKACYAILTLGRRYPPGRRRPTARFRPPARAGAVNSLMPSRSVTVDFRATRLSVWWIALCAGLTSPTRAALRSRHRRRRTLQGSARCHARCSMQRHPSSGTRAGCKQCGRESTSWIPMRFVWAHHCCRWAQWKASEQPQAHAGRAKLVGASCACLPWLCVRHGRQCKCPCAQEGAARSTRAPRHTAALAPPKQGRLETQNQGAMPVDAAKHSSKYTCGSNYGACWIERSSMPGCQAIASRRTTEAPAARAAAALAGGCGAAATARAQVQPAGRLGGRLCRDAVGLAAVGEGASYLP